MGPLALLPILPFLALPGVSTGDVLPGGMPAEADVVDGSHDGLPWATVVVDSYLYGDGACEIKLAVFHDHGPLDDWSVPGCSFSFQGVPADATLTKFVGNIEGVPGIDPETGTA